MLYPKAGKRWMIGVATMVSAVLIALSGVNGFQSDPGPTGRTDLVQIKGAPLDGDKEMPDVYFLHDRHTEALGDPSCVTCHSTVEGKIVFRFKTAEPLPPEEAKVHFHDNCVACHRDTLATGKPSGPLAADCRSCHGEKPPRSDRTAMGFDPSLHYRHEASPSIRPFADEQNCGVCHHVFDPQSEKTVYAKGQEGSCRYCHKETATVDPEIKRTIRPMGQAAHESCVTCHQSLAAIKVKTGPVTCAGCHDKAGQARIEKVSQVPRMRRGQPDAVLMATRLKQAATAGKEKAFAGVMAVAFDHKGHEQAVGSCRSCHHDSLESCGVCHTPNGDRKGGFVRLEQAMHGQAERTSCISCHDRAKTAAACAGCHGQMPARPVSQAQCRLCHNVDIKPGDPGLGDPGGGAGQAEAAILARKRPFLSVARKDIPETVEIAAMADEYQGALLPHGKIVRALEENLDDNPMVRYFHREATTLCQGCHHNSPPALKPPACASCHGISADNDGKGRPGLMGAYHGQCMGCHQKMGIDKPAATDCTACHKKRGQDLATSKTPVKE